MSQTKEDIINNHIYLSPSDDYWRHLLKLCERTIDSGKNVLLITYRHDHMSMQEKPYSVQLLDRMLVFVPMDIESAPQLIVSLIDCMPQPDLIIFDLYSVFIELLKRPILQQKSTDTLVRLIAKCVAALCNYKDMLHKNKQINAKDNVVDDVDTVIIMPKETYPLTPAQFKLLIELYFYNNKLYGRLADLPARISKHS